MGGRERKKNTRHETRQMRNRRVRTTEKESLLFLSILGTKAFLQTQKREAKTPTLYIGAVDRGREREREKGEKGLYNWYWLAQRNSRRILAI